MFFSVKFRDDVYHNILTSDLPNLLEHGNISALTQLWGSGQISNFEYLTHLNKHAGRSFNDLMQYPVFPFILRDYISETLDLQDPNIYRSVLDGNSVTVLRLCLSLALKGKILKRDTVMLINLKACIRLIYASDYSSKKCLFNVPEVLRNVCVYFKIPSSPPDMFQKVHL